MHMGSSNDSRVAWASRRQMLAGDLNARGWTDTAMMDGGTRGCSEEARLSERESGGPPRIAQAGHVTALVPLE